MIDDSALAAALRTVAIAYHLHACSEAAARACVRRIRTTIPKHQRPLFDLCMSGAEPGRVACEAVEMSTSAQNSKSA